ncbi:hypothetical protein ACAN107058_13795 [Paracidovorax anthurii]|uniref:Uncharacterized protein n=1 Tax=Paracidovorax anthurii TaxID=78229 RepID=A0A328YV62_9BURK|nr:hypothetical protein AX018_103517 [Paracidovorax anthurii]
MISVITIEGVIALAAPRHRGGRVPRAVECLNIITLINCVQFK